MNKGDKIPAEEILLRRTWAKDKKYLDPKTGRPNSRAFTPRTKDKGELSVDIKSLTTYKLAILDPQIFSLFSFHTSFAYSLGLQCNYDPWTIELNGIDNLAHSLILGIPEDDEAIAGLLARNSSPQAPF